MLLFQPGYKNIRKIRMILANQLCDVFSIKVTIQKYGETDLTENMLQVIQCLCLSRCDKIQHLTKSA